MDKYITIKSDDDDKKTINNDSLPWAIKYRPDKLDDVIGHREIIDTIKKMVINKSLCHMLFFGPPGTGKTSTILAVANELYGDKARQFMILEMNASAERGIDSVRTKINKFV